LWYSSLLVDAHFVAELEPALRASDESQAAKAGSA
jgi:hypothetical protein